MSVDWKKPIQTRDGRAASLRYINGRHAFCAAGNESFAVDFLNGKHLVSGEHSPYDLVNVEAPPAVDWAKPVQTRDGRKARVLCTDLRGLLPVAAAVEQGGFDVIHRVRLDGSAGWGGLQNALDIVNVPQRRPHADVIKAWAEGAEVQFREGPGFDWRTIDRPVFTPELEYRVKP